jgi:hypothetical protein
LKVHIIPRWYTKPKRAIAPCLNSAEARGQYGRKLPEPSHSQNVLIFNVSGGLSLVGQACGKLKRGSKVSKFFWPAKKFPHLAIPDLPEESDLEFKPERCRFCPVG